MMVGRRRGRRQDGRLRLREDVDGQGEARRLRLDPDHPDVDEGSDEARRGRRDPARQRDQGRAVHRAARRAVAVSVRVERDAAHRRPARRLRVVRSRRCEPLSVRARLHRRQRAEPQPLLAAAVQPRRHRRGRARVRAAAGDDLRRAEGGPPPLDGLRRSARATRRRQAEHRPRHALADRVHHRPRSGLPGERTLAADHGRVRVPSLPGDVDHGAERRRTRTARRSGSPTTRSSSPCSAPRSTAPRSVARLCRSSTTSSGSRRRSRRPRRRSTSAPSPPPRSRSARRHRRSTTCRRCR